MDKDSLLHAAKLGGDYLINAMKADGRFIYEYNPMNGHRSWKYNILRHSGAAYSLLELYEVTREKRFLTVAEKALNYLISAIVPCESKIPNTSCVLEDGNVKLGGNALAVIVLAKFTSITGDERYMKNMQSLVRWIVSTMGPYGEFKVHKQSQPQGHTLYFKSDYYPGEALLALNRLYALDGDTTWLDAAEKGTEWLINIRDMGKERDDLEHDHWLLYAINDLYKYKQNPLYMNHAFLIAEAILHKQRQGLNRENADAEEYSPDWLGSYYTPPRSTPTATRTEGLISAYHLAELAGDTLRLGQILKGIDLGIRFQLSTQCSPEKSEKLLNPSRALGGFFESLEGYDIRIDYVQHNISALLGYYKILSDYEP